MTRVGSLLEAEHQLCYAHCIQLVVLVVLYRRRDRTTTAAPESSPCNTDSDIDDDDDDYVLDNPDGEEGLDIVVDGYDVLVELSDNTTTLLTRFVKLSRFLNDHPRRTTTHFSHT